jgi:prepilin-type N-terminal cleavage/methylation domain-containing protein/prepilin-type processing-associated H-X9-DG protein
MCPRRVVRVGFTLVELLVVIAIIGVMVGLLLPAVQAAREAARRMSCGNNVKQIALGIHNYHAAYGQMPMQCGGTFQDAGGQNNFRMLSFLVPLLPFVEQQPLWETISTRQGNFPAMGPQPWNLSYAPWRTNVSTFRCPSDPTPPAPGGAGCTNYGACLGDGILHTGIGGIHENGTILEPTATVHLRGIFKPRRSTRFSDCLDGTSNTILIGERVVDSGLREIIGQPLIIESAVHLMDPAHETCTGPTVIDPSRPRFYTASAPLYDHWWRRGHGWAFGLAFYSSINTVRPPNRESCQFASWERGDGTYTASSRHQGGCHVAFTDGSVRFISNSIDAGNQRVGIMVAGMESPYGVWGALGTAAGGEVRQLD